MKQKKAALCFVLLLVSVSVFGLLTGCGSEKEGSAGQIVMSGSGRVVKETPDEPQETEETEQELYMIQELNMMEEAFTLMSLSDGQQLRYGYSLTTRFLDKYGNTSNALEFTPGNVVVIGELLPSSALSYIRMSDQVWKQTDVKKYGIDEEKGIFTLGRTKYRITPDTAVFSDIEPAELADVGTEDVLQVIGQDKDILSVVITTGHGYLQLVNTDAFKDSMICIGSRIFTMISGDMTLPVSEGTYKVTVANNGYGGTAEFNVARNETTVIDLETMKGEGPKFCQLSFAVSVTGASIYLDGSLVDVSQVIPVQYGQHTLQVAAEGYDSWTKTLVVNSPTAQLVLDLSDEEASSSQESGGQAAGNNSSGNSSNSSQNSSAGSNNSSGNSSGNSSSSNSGNNNSSGSSSRTEVDYLTTLNNLISTYLLTK